MQLIISKRIILLISLAVLVLATNSGHVDADAPFTEVKLLPSDGAANDFF